MYSDPFSRARTNVIVFASYERNQAPLTGAPFRARRINDRKGTAHGTIEINCEPRREGREGHVLQTTLRIATYPASRYPASYSISRIDVSCI